MMDLCLEKGVDFFGMVGGAWRSTAWRPPPPPPRPARTKSPPSHTLSPNQPTNHPHDKQHTNKPKTRRGRALPGAAQARDGQHHGNNHRPLAQGARLRQGPRAQQGVLSHARVLCVCV